MEDLPAPFPLNICEYLSDLKSLDALTSASQVFRNVFALHGPALVERVMFNSLHPDLIRLLRAHVYLHQHPEIVKADGHTVEEALNCLLDAARTPFSKAMAGPALFDILHHFTTVHNLATIILVSKLRTLRSLEVDTRDDDSSPPSFRDAGNSKPPPDRVLKPYANTSFSPPSWIEEQRVMRAVLRLTLFSDLVGLLTPPSHGIATGKPAKRDTFGVVCPWADGDQMAALRWSLSDGDTRRAVDAFALDEFDEVCDSLDKLWSSKNAMGTIVTFPWLPFYGAYATDPNFSTREITSHESNVPKASHVPDSWHVPAVSDFPPAAEVPFLDPFCPKGKPYPSKPVYRDAQWLFQTQYEQTPCCLDWPPQLSLKIRASGHFRAYDWIVFRSLGLSLWDSRRVTLELTLSPWPRSFLYDLYPGIPETQERLVKRLQVLSRDELRSTGVGFSNTWGSIPIDGNLPVSRCQALYRAEVIRRHATWTRSGGLGSPYLRLSELDRQRIHAYPMASPWGEIWPQNQRHLPRLVSRNVPILCGPASRSVSADEFDKLYPTGR